MEIMRKYFLLTVVWLLSGPAVYGQISTREEPVSFSTNVPDIRTNPKAVKSFASLDLTRIEQEDIEDEAKGLPPRFGYRHRVNLTLDNAGEWTVLPNGDQLWRLALSCEDAVSINLLYDKFWLPEGAKFWVYGSDRKHSIGAFTSANNNGGSDHIQGFATGLIYGNQVILEYYLPNGAKETGVISLAYVVHGYRYILLPDRSVGYEQSGPCHVNVNCEEGADWQHEKNAVALILVNGNRNCTGSLVNTTAGDFHPYLLTANHCLWGGDGGPHAYYDADEQNSPVLEDWSFYWHYESPGCTNAEPDEMPPPMTTGAKLVANSENGQNDNTSDFALLDLSGAGGFNPNNSDPGMNPNITPYFLGWDCSGNPGTGGVGIHHPKGDIKKISTYTTTPQTTEAFSDIIVTDTAAVTWRVVWAETTHNGITRHSGTDGGSSGSPLLNSNRRIIGQLITCQATCSSSPKRSWYGKLSVSWTGNGTLLAARRLKDWLDVSNSNIQTLDGIQKYYITGGASEVCYEGSTFKLNPLPQGGGTVYWKVSNPSLFSLSPATGDSTTVSRTGSDPGDAILSAHIGHINNPAVATRLITACPPPAITGPTLICYGSPQTFSFSPWKSGYYWDKSSNLSLSGTTSDVITASAANSNGAAGWLSVKNSSGVEVLRQDVWVGPPVITIEGPEDVCSAFYPGYNAYHYVATPTHILSAVSPLACAIWTVTPSGQVVDLYHVNDNHREVMISFLPWADYYEVKYQVGNACGCGPQAVKYVWAEPCYSPSPPAYPNPVSDILYVEIEQAPRSGQNPSGARPSTPDPTFDIRLYDGQGNLVRQTASKAGTVQLNVANLPNGLYYLQIYGEKSRRPPQIQQIIVEH